MLMCMGYLVPRIDNSGGSRGAWGAAAPLKYCVDGASLVLRTYMHVATSILQFTRRSVVCLGYNQIR